MKKMVSACLVTSLLLASCSTGQSNDNKGSSNLSDDKSQSSKSNKNSKNNNSNHASSQSSNDKSQEDANQENTHSNTYYAKVWLTAIESYRGNSDIKFDDLDIKHGDVSGKLIDPYLPDVSAKFPEGTEMLTASVHAAGSVYYKNNGDGTITIYPVPSQFNGPIYGDEYGKKESQRVLHKASTVKLYDASDSEINKISALMSSEPASYGNPIDTQSNSDSDDDNSSDSTTVTRSNVIDLVEDYEGHKLDTDTYTYKEPEEDSDGNWGFSFTDKDGELAGSYIIDQDGIVTKYDKHGDEE